MQAEICQFLSDLRTSNFEDKGYITKLMAEQLKADGVYLRSKIDEVLQEISQLSDHLVRYSDFKQAQHSLLLGVIIALYVPLSFVTSIFGMNTIEINGSSLPTALVWEIAIPLTAVTILVPILFGRVLRATAVFSEIITQQHRNTSMKVKRLAILATAVAYAATIFGYLLTLIFVGPVFGLGYETLLNSNLLLRYMVLLVPPFGTFWIGFGAAVVAVQFFLIRRSHPKSKLVWIFWVDIVVLAIGVLTTQAIMLTDGNDASICKSVIKVTFPMFVGKTRLINILQIALKSVHR